MKGLFISPDLGLSGADKSLYATLRSLREILPSLLVPFWRGGGSKKKLLERLEKQKIHNLQKLLLRPLPRSYCYLGAPSGPLEPLKERFKQAMWRLYQPLFKREIRSYSFLHLNSLSLYPAISEKLPCILHVREVSQNPSALLKKALLTASGVIFIDETTRRPFRELPLKNWITLENPFEMREPEKGEVEALREAVSLPESHTLFALIGDLIPVKGVERAIRAFLKLQEPKAALLLVGKTPEKAYKKRCLSLARGDRRIRFLGHLENISPLYALTDVVLRADPFFALGRTALEGLYSGCRLILPGEESDLQAAEALSPFKREILLYQPGSLESLFQAMQALSRHKASNRKFFGNLASYGKRFEEFIRLSLPS